MLLGLTIGKDITILSNVPKLRSGKRLQNNREHKRQYIFEKTGEKILMKKTLVLSTLLALAAMGAACGDNTANNSAKNTANAACRARWRSRKRCSRTRS